MNAFADDPSEVVINFPILLPFGEMRDKVKSRKVNAKNRSFPKLYQNQMSYV